MRTRLGDFTKRVGSGTNYLGLTRLLHGSFHPLFQMLQRSLFGNTVHVLGSDWRKAHFKFHRPFSDLAFALQVEKVTAGDSWLSHFQFLISSCLSLLLYGCMCRYNQM